MDTNTDIVYLDGLSKSYADQCVVNNISLSVKQGEYFGLLGPNGAGKTTTLRMLLGMTPPDSGVLNVLGHAIPEQAQQMRCNIGVVPQMDNLDPDFSVIENLRTYASYFGLKAHGVAMQQRIEELLDFANLRARAEATIESLSGGMKRRLTLARALVNDPQLLILDEPTTGLDPQARQLIWQRLRELKRAGRTLILTTHYMEEAQRLCDRLAIMDHGRIIAEGTPANLIEQHIEPHVIEVYGAGLSKWLDNSTVTSQERVERLGETAFVYSRDEAPLISELCQQEDLQFLHRRANLEDVFQKLTGRELRE
jgi:lipooligosaccharide transport system ATP-binding protein